MPGRTAGPRAGPGLNEVVLQFGNGLELISHYVHLMTKPCRLNSGDAEDPETKLDEVIVKGIARYVAVA